MPCGVFRCISVDFGVFRCISVFTLTPFLSMTETSAFIQSFHNSTFAYRTVHIIDTQY